MHMKTTIAVLLSAAIMGGAGYTAYACGGSSHGSMGKSHMMESKSHDAMHDEAMDKSKVIVTLKQAVDTSQKFVKSNLQTSEAGETTLTEMPMMGTPVYATDVTLADGTTGTLYVDAGTGKPMGMAYGDTMGMFHSAMGDMESMHGSGDDAEDSSATDHSKHNH